MVRQSPAVCFVLASFWLALTGCRPQEPFYLKQVHDDEAYYKGVATEIDNADISYDRLPDAGDAKAAMVAPKSRHPTDLGISRWKRPFRLR